MGVYLEENRSSVSKRFPHAMFIAASFTIARTCKQPTCPCIDEWRNSTFHYTMEHYSVTRKKEILLFATMSLDPKRIMLHKMSRTKTNAV